MVRTNNNMMMMMMQKIEGTEQRPEREREKIGPKALSSVAKFGWGKDRVLPMK